MLLLARIQNAHLRVCKKSYFGLFSPCKQPILYRSNKNSALKLPPGPKPLPIIGNIHQLIGPPMHRLLRDMAGKFGPLMHLQLGEVSTFVVSSPDVAEEFMKTHDIIFANRPQLLCPRVFNYNCTDIAFASFGDYWRQMRKICVIELLSSKRVQSFCSIRENEVLNLMRLIFSNKESTFNLSKELISFMYGLTARIAFGKKSKYQEDFISIVQENIKIASGFHIADLYPSVKFIQIISEMSPKIRKSQKKNDSILDSIIDEHREKRKMAKDTDAETKEDLVDVLLRVQECGDFGSTLTDNNIKSVIMDIFSAGSETTSTTLGWAMSELLKNPETMKKAQDEVRKIFDRSQNVEESGLDKLKYLQAVIKETMRLHPPVPMLIPRESSEQCEINGYDIPAKSRVIVNAWAIGRDSRYWPDAEKFNPDRFLGSAVDYQGKDFKYIPFGAGRRTCPGISFGVINVELILAQLLYHFDWKLPDGLSNEELDMSELFGLTVRRKNDLCLIPSVTALCGVFLILYVLVKFINTNRSRESSLKLPPGPKPLPIIGNLHQLLGSQTHHILRDLAKRYGPLMHLQLGEVSTLIVSSPEAAEQFMKTHDTIFSYRPQLLAPRIFNYDCTDIAFAPFGDYWRQLRKICMMELLSSKRVQIMQ
ncbi:hypothetical protein M9H77_15078 [Catharanthus roseus]|uniref:Uncharacterized protein n=1 Tax=Catharanthus roseus TaxID=4058 RepID=A0ACC0BQ18_CATRO|nr:hypothetical protein M9H77_15078 [Catharanthus roseus]